jgi:hypothetical protein
LAPFFLAAFFAVFFLAAFFFFLATVNPPKKGPGDMLARRLWRAR